MFAKNFIIVIPDSNGDNQILPLSVSHETKSALDESTVLQVCNDGIDRYLNDESPNEREDAILDALCANHYMAHITTETYSIITTK